MPVNSGRAAGSKNYVTKGTIAPKVGSLLALALLAALLIISTIAAMNGERSADLDVLEDADAGGEIDLNTLLHTETVVIDKLRDYIHEFEAKVDLVKRQTLAIKAINDAALNDTHKYVNNPLNAVTILTRFTQDWPLLRSSANATYDIEGSIGEEGRKSLVFPTEDDLDEAVGNLLRIQDIYKLAPERLAVGEVNGVKLGSEMSWSDCLEIGRKSEENGDYLIAKFWMETALGKLPAAANDTVPPTPDNRRWEVESKNGRFEILEALLNAEYNVGHNEEALDIVNELMLLKPSNKRMHKAKEMIEHAMKKHSKSAKKRNAKRLAKKEKKRMTPQSTEESLIMEICRDVSGTRSHSDSKQQQCKLEHTNLPHLLLMPLRVEYLRLDPFIVIYHDVFSLRQVQSLIDFVEEHDEDSPKNELTFTKMGVRKMKAINRLLADTTGHRAELFTDWQLAGRHFENGLDLEQLVQETRGSNKMTANVLFNLREAKLGGAIAFPQLELSVEVPWLSLLYWSHLNEFRDYDYRTKQHVCPIIAGMQITAFTSIKYAAL